MMTRCPWGRPVGEDAPVLYHGTSLQAKACIDAEGFRAGREEAGTCATGAGMGEGVYFTPDPIRATGYTVPVGHDLGWEVSIGRKKPSEALALGYGCVLATRPMPDARVVDVHLGEANPDAAWLKILDAWIAREARKDAEKRLAFWGKNAPQDVKDSIRQSEEGLLEAWQDDRLMVTEKKPQTYLKMLSRAAEEFGCDAVRFTHGENAGSGWEDTWVVTNPRAIRKPREVCAVDLDAAAVRRTRS